MSHSPEHQPESLNLHPTLKAIIEAIGLAAAAMILQGCDGKNPNEAMLRAVGWQEANASTVSSEMTSPDTAEEIRRQCASAAAEEAGIKAGTEGLKDSQALAEDLTEQCLEDRGVVVSGD